MFARRACRVATGVATKLLSNTTTGTPPQRAAPGWRALLRLIARVIARRFARYSALLPSCRFALFRVYLAHVTNHR
jgi:hypothetical protein